MYLTYDEFKGLDNDMKEAITDKEVNDFHNELDKVVHKHIGHSSDEDEEKERLTKKVKDYTQKNISNCKRSSLIVFYKN